MRVMQTEVAPRFSAIQGFINAITEGDAVACIRLAARAVARPVRREKAGRERRQFSASFDFLSIVERISHVVRDAPALPKPWDQTLRPHHVILVLLSKLFGHHPLFGMQSRTKHESEYHEATGACDPICKEQSLSERIDKYRSVHWMPHRSVNSRSYEPMIFTKLKTVRPVCA